MTIRRDRNRTARKQVAELFAEQVHCPDCDSDAELTERAPGVYALTIRHDETCPQWRAMTKETMA